MRNLDLTPQMIECCRLLVNGLSYKQIAGELNLAEGTVKQYVNRACHRAGVRGRTQLAVWFVRREAAVAAKGE